MALAVMVVVPVPDATVVPVSIPLTNIFIPVTVVFGTPALLGAAVSAIVAAVPLLAALVNADALAEVLTRKIVSLFRVTFVVPKVFGEEDVLGLYV